jgi:hypothetical protein
MLRDTAAVTAAANAGARSIGCALLSSGAFCGRRPLSHVLRIALEALRDFPWMTAAPHVREVHLIGYPGAGTAPVAVLRGLLPCVVGETLAFDGAQGARGGLLSYLRRRRGRTRRTPPRWSGRRNDLATESGLSRSL